MKTNILISFKRALILAALIFSSAILANAQSTPPVGIAGLTHNHIYGILNEYAHGRVNIVGIAEPSKALQEKYRKQFHLPDSLFFTDLKTMVAKRKPAIVLGYNAIAYHVDIVEVCAPLHIAVMVEKPLAATLSQAKRMEALADQYHIKLLTNYETTWYPSVVAAYDIINKDSIGAIRKMVVHDGHQGPVEIGCSEEFLSWLTDPVLNGAGALNDFGCYGADLMTWLMHGKRPIAVTAIARHYKPNIYPKVEDDATILVEYPGATGQIEASWNWPFSIKDMEVFGETGYLHALDGNNLTMRMRENIKSVRKVEPIQPPYNSPIPYFTAVLQKSITGEGDDRSSLKYNMIVMEILDAAKRSIKEGRRIVL
ncbi:MAG TPA: Gfo/Idh/MocA family oxidoreductase [Mucilaginibacter sp.]|jgi:predicted dehydrogenase|nr:Gfo/Idh/MocA family oxidoreductase [Mucilaginibacter sp.]